MQVKELSSVQRLKIEDLQEQIEQIDHAEDQLRTQHDKEVGRLRKLRQDHIERRTKLLADLFEDKPGHYIELSEDGQFAVQRFEMPRQPLYEGLYGDANAAYADRARQSAAAYGPLGFPPGVPR